jgi:dTMP kinase
MTSERGRFIVIEGLDGAGTTTQVERLGDALRARGIAVELTREPTNGPLGAVLRQAIEGRLTLDPVAMALAFAADRADHLFDEQGGVERHLREGRWVVCDRYLLSSFAYQPSERIEREWVAQINAHSIEPDVTVFVDVEPEICVERITARSSSDELFHAVEPLAAARANYRAAIDAGAPVGVLLEVDGARGVDEVAADIEQGVVGAVALESPAV